MKDCKEAVKPECANAPIDCITGSAYKFTLQPTFETDIQANAKNYHVKCHIRFKESKILYRIYYEVLVDKLNFKTERRYKDIESKDLEYLKSGTVPIEFIYANHATNLDIERDYILDIYNNPKGTPISYKVLPFKRKVKKKRPFYVRTMPTLTSHLTYVQFDEPFAYR